MPAIPNPVLIVKCGIITVAGAFQNILYYQPPSGITTGTQMTAICNAAKATFAPLYAAYLWTGCKFTQVNATYMAGAVELIGSSTTAPVSGTQGNQAVGDGVAVVVRKNTNLADRPNRGRWFLSGLDVSAIDTDNPNEVSFANIGPFQALGSAMVADQTWDGLLFHARHWNRKTSVLVPIADATIASRMASARARRRHAPDYAE